MSHLGRLRSHLAVPLHWTAYALMSSVIGSSALGLLFWVIASRAYSAEAVGQSSAAVAALMFLTGVGGLFLDSALYRYLPRAGDATGRMVARASLLTVVAACIATAVFLSGLDVWAPALSFLRSSPWVIAVSLGAVVGSCLLILQDGALIGMRRAGWVPVKNIAYNVLKLPLLVGLAAALPTYGILVAWIVPIAFIAVPSAFLLARRLIPQHAALTRSHQEVVDGRTVRGYVAGNYAGYLCMLASRNIPPLLVIHEAGAKAAAYFYPPWLIFTSLLLLATNVSTSLVVEGARDRDQLVVHARQAFRQTGRLVLPISAGLALGAPYVLRFFGPDYADEGSTLLRLLAVSLIPGSVSVLSFGVARVQNRVASIVLAQVVLAALVLGLSVVLLPGFGIEGVGVGCLIAQTGTAVVLFWTHLRPLVVRPRLRTGTL